VAENKNIGMPVSTLASGFPFDRVAQIRPGVRYAQRDFPGNGRFSVPSPADASARGGEIQNYDSMGRVADIKVGKNMKGGR
jgi:hypothetical protein